MIKARRRWLTISAAVLLFLALAPSPAHAVPLATITGHVLDNGVPLPGVTVRIYPVNMSLPPVPTVTTDAAGAFTLSNLSIAQYQVSFLLPGGPPGGGTTFYAGGRVNLIDAVPVPTTPGGTVTLEESVPPHGSVEGHITRSNGTPVASAGVLMSLNAGGGGYAVTDANGYYSLPYIWVGANKIRITPPSGSGPTQFGNGTTDYSQAPVYNVVAGQTMTIDETLVPVGTVSGRVTSAGAPAAFVSVTLLRPNGQSVQFASTASDGTYRMVAPSGTYVLQFRTSNGLTQYASRKTDLPSADPVTVVADQTVVVDEQLIAPGTVRGTLLKADGTPATSTQVIVTDGLSRFYSTTTNASGAWQVSALPGAYTVQFSVSGLGPQWATGKSSAATADHIVVGDGQTVVVNDQLAPAGTLSVTAKDKRSGEPISSFCVSVFTSVCTTTGTVTLARLPGAVDAFASASDPIYLPARIQTEVQSGQTTDVALEFVKSATITTVVRDAVTGDPVGNACIGLVKPLEPSMFHGGGWCSAADGTVTMAHLEAGAYNLFVEVHDGLHGMQWVGVGHGVGAQLRARLVLVGEGETATVPDIGLDGIGSVTGVVTDKATGQPLANTFVGLSSFNAGYGDPGPATATDAQGGYTLDELGPYDWTLFFSSPGYAPVFSGGAGDRLLARGVTVTAGQVNTFNQTLKVGKTLTGTVSNADGTPPSSVRVTLVHALTGDELSISDVAGTTPYSLQVAAPLLVKFKVNESWVGGDDFLHAQIYLILPSTAPITLTLP